MWYHFKDAENVSPCMELQNHGKNDTLKLNGSFHIQMYLRLNSFGFSEMMLINHKITLIFHAVKAGTKCFS